MMPVRILGIGTTLACGEGREALEAALRSDRPGLPSDVTTGRLAEFVSPDKCRRLDPMARMALLSASLGLRDAGLSLEDAGNSRTGIVFGTALGPQTSTFSFLDGINQYGDALVSSLAFTNSVHNTPASIVSILLGIRGPIRTIAASGYTAGAALLTALTWVRNDDVRRVVLMLGEECSDVLQYVVRVLGGGTDAVRPFSPDCAYAPRPGLVALVLGRAKSGEGYGRIASLDVNLTVEEAAARIAASGSPLFCAASGRAEDHGVYRELRRRAPSAAYSPRYGSLETGMGVELAIAALTLRARTVFPVPDAGDGGAAHRAPFPAEIRSVLVASVCSPGRVTLAALEK